MGKYKKILVAVDGSESSKNAFRQACRLACSDKCWITALTTIPIFQDQFESLSAKEKATKALREQGEKALAEIEKIAKEEGVNVKTLLEEGHPSEVIRDVADENGCDLVVMGRRGKTRIERALMGSVTARVIGQASTDVLVVQRDAAVEFGKILLPTDGSKFSKAATERAIGLAGAYGGELAALSVVDFNEEFYTEAPEAVDDFVKWAKTVVDGVKKKAEAKGVKAEGFVREAEAYEAITSLAKEQGATLVVMGSHGRTGLRRLLMGSVTEKVIGHTSIPVLVVKH